MENAAEALKMGAWVLIFVVALTISINAFTESRQSIDAIVADSDREYITTYVEQSDSTQRVVGYESIIPSIYRAFNENYKIIFPEDYVLYSKIAPNGEETGINYIDLEKESVSDTSKEEFIKRVLFGVNKNVKDEYADNHFPNLMFPDEKNGLYSKINNKSYIEYLGVYYQEETEGGTSTPDANKTEKRVITYKEFK